MSDFHIHDHRRLERLGMPEAVLCDPKTDAQLIAIIGDLVAHGAPALLTRFSADRLASIPAELRRQLTHDPISSTATINGTLQRRRADIAIVAAGTSDQSVAAEAAGWPTDDAAVKQLQVGKKDTGGREGGHRE